MKFNFLQFITNFPVAEEDVAVTVSFILNDKNVSGASKKRTLFFLSETFIFMRTL